MHTNPIVSIEHVHKRFSTAAGDISILENVSALILPGETVAIIGPSGSGKTTLLSLLGLLDVPTEGEITIASRKASELTEREQAQFRNETIGFIFQSFELISPFTVAENVAVPLDIRGTRPTEAAVAKILEEVGLTHRKDALPATLSGGEKQRVAIARALVHEPPIILADEPTGSLDRETGEKVLTLLLEAVSKRQTTLLLITHDESVAARMQRVFEIKDRTLYERK